ncbi:MAG: hypothetical protein V5786_03175 [Psychromonas sp.]
MKKLIIAGAIIATGASAYILTQQELLPTYPFASTYNVLEYIPADTPIFAGQLEPFPLKDYIASTPNMMTASDHKKRTDSSLPASKFLFNLMDTYQTSLSDADLFINTFGLPDNVRAYFYTLGWLPVFKIEIANEQAIWTLLDKAELESGFTHKKGTLEDISYRIYRWDKSDPINGEVIVAINNGFLTITFNSAYHEETLLAKALGLVAAEESLADSAMIEETIKKHNFDNASLAFINHIEIVKGLTTEDGNQLARQITRLDKVLDMKSVLAEFRNKQCATEFATIAANWPRTVSGYTQLDIDDAQSTIGISTIIESNNQVILNALSAIRGFIPKYTADIDNNVLAMGLGFNVSELSNTLNKIWGDLQTPTYRCQPLAEIQTEITQLGKMIAIVSIGANMANGVQGLSFGLLDYALSKIDNAPQLDSVDALFTVSVDNPEGLFNSIKMFIPELQKMQLTKGSEPIQLSNILPVPAEFNIDPKLVIKGKHIVIYNGEKAKKVADQLTSESLSANGIYNLSYDVKKAFIPLVTATELYDDEIIEESIEDIMLSAEYDVRVQMSIDINEQGLIFKSKLNTKAPN